MLTFEGQKIQGSQSIVAKLTSLPFQQCKHNITTVDCQPSGSGGMLVFVSGNLQLAGEQHALKFSQVFFLLAQPSTADLIFINNFTNLGYLYVAFCYQMFHLMPTPQGSFYVLNDIFRLNYA
ncbi:hypothetical protein Goklo_016415 [Gossypium klotzschianum]|uniref:NTF2 domain-containing protein n=1 Tax=Gossypium klotzschianum TaxID=34286 RepID=A0A7J8UE24_9ROSI|nr:hypothetical protein [Gossypium klotzschianum]